MHYKYMKSSFVEPLIQYTSSQITNLYYTILQKRETLAHDFIEHKCNYQMFPNQNSLILLEKQLTVADMLSRTFTKEQLQIHQLQHKQLPPQKYFSIMKDNQLKPVPYLVKHEEIKYNQKNDWHPILADYGDDQFSIRINNKGEDIQIQTLYSYFFNPLFHLNPNTKDLQKIKRNHSYNNQLSSMTLIFLVIRMNQLNHKIRRIKTQPH